MKVSKATAEIEHGLGAMFQEVCVETFFDFLGRSRTSQLVKNSSNATPWKCRFHGKTSWRLLYAALPTTMRVERHNTPSPQVYICNLSCGFDVDRPRQGNRRARLSAKRFAMAFLPWLDDAVTYIRIYCMRKSLVEHVKTEYLFEPCRTGQGDTYQDEQKTLLGAQA